MTNDQAGDSGIGHWSLVTGHSSWSYPIHLGVTEAGEGEDARIKSAIGIGSLLLDGIGDTIRVSLTEDSIHEIPVAKKLIAVASGIAPTAPKNPPTPKHDPFTYRRRATQPVTVAGTEIGGEHVFNRSPYCPLSCSETPEAPECVMCRSGGSGSF